MGGPAWESKRASTRSPTQVLKMAQPGYPQQSATPSFVPGDAFSKVELSISCSGLKDLDTFSRSDPIVFVYEGRGSEWLKLGRTEVVDNNLNPKVLITESSRNYEEREYKKPFCSCTCMTAKKKCCECMEWRLGC